MGVDELGVDKMVSRWSGNKPFPWHHSYFRKGFCMLSAVNKGHFSHWVTLRERLRTLKFFTEDQCFYYYHKFSIKSYDLDV